MIIFQPVPGQESRNAQIAQKYQAGFLANSSEDAVSRIRQILENPAGLDRLRAGARNISKPDAAEKITEMAEHES